VDGAQDAVLHDADNVVLRGFLEHDKSGGLKPQVRLVVLGNLFDESLKGLLGMRSSVDFWTFRISRSATVPGR